MEIFSGNRKWCNGPGEECRMRNIGENNVIIR